MKKKLLIHFCCAPCGIELIPFYKNDYEIFAFWFNPNIQSHDEYRKRRASFYRLCLDEGIIYSEGTSFSWKEWYDAVINAEIKGLNRCQACYTIRLKAAFKTMIEKNMDLFTTTLLSSPHQKHDLIKKTGEEISGEQFLCKDFRSTYYRGKNTAHNRGMYMQKYCGCIFSKLERDSQKQAKYKTSSH